MPSLLDAYLSSLPEGLRSLPRAQIKGNILDEQLEWLRELGVPLDPRVAGAVRSAQPLGRSMEWVSEVVCNAISLNAYEGYPSEAAWTRAVYERQQRIFRTPLYRALMLVLSPTLMTMGAQQRWGAYRRGSELTVEKWQKSGPTMLTFATLTYPPGLYTPLLLRGLGGMLRAAIEAAGAKESQLELLEAESRPGGARYRLSYRA